MTKRRTLRRARGFTLIEVLISTAIFAIGSLGVLAMVTTSISLQRGSRQAIEATTLANWQMDRLQIVGPTDASWGCTTGVGCFQGPVGTAPSTTVTTIRLQDVINQPVMSSIYYELVTFVDTPPAASCGSCFRARVTVFWPRDPQKQTIPAGGTGFLDCSAAANAGLCHRADFYSYRQH